MAAAIIDQVKVFIDSQRDSLISLLRDLVEAESPSAHPECHDSVRRILSGALMDVGYLVREPGMRGSARHIFARPAQRSRGRGNQLLVGHFDTVWPIGTIDKRPFTVNGNTIRGPGVFDMKGGLAQIVLALRTIRELHLEPPLTPVVLVNADEEIGSRTSSHYIRMLARRAERAFVLEPAMGAEGDIKTERKGIGRFTVTVFGKAAHAGLDPEGGASAILELSHVIQALFALNDPDKGITVNVGTVDGGIQPNVIAPHSTAVVDVRVPTLESGGAIERTIHGIKPVTPGVRLHIEGRIGRPSMEATPPKALGNEMGLDLRSARAGGGSDGNTTSQYTATIDGLGPVGDGAHADHEHLHIDKTLERAALLTLLLLSQPVTKAGPGQ
jgi:glutamate carboxypeptidase